MARRLGSTAELIRASVFAELAPRIAERTARGGSLVPFHIGDTHLAPPAPATFREVVAQDEHGLYAYGPLGGDRALLEAFAARLASTGRAFAPLDPACHLLVGAGATHALFCAARAILDPGDEVLVAAPYWPLSVGIFAACGAITREVPFTSRLYEASELDAAAPFQAAITPRTRALYFITPNNPDGKVLSAAALASLARLAREHDLWVFADEVYADFVYDGAHVSIARLEGMAERTITAYSFSKSHALAGARVGMVAAPADVIAAARRVATHTVFNVPLVAQRSATRALLEGERWLDATRIEYRTARDEAVTALAPLRSLGVRFHAPEGGSYVFLDFGELLGGRSLVTLLERAIDEGVLLAPGEACGERYASSARLCFTATPRAALREGIELLRTACSSYAASMRDSS